MHQNFDLDTLKHKIALQLHQDAYFFSSQNIERHLNIGFLIMRFYYYYNILIFVSTYVFYLFIAEAVMTNLRITSTFAERNVEKELVSE